jgi:hypothetical protein
MLSLGQPRLRISSKKPVIPDKLGEAQRRSGIAANSEFTPRSRIFALRARPG